MVTITYPLVVDTLGKMRAIGNWLSGYCLDCRKPFDIDLDALIAERGEHHPATYPEGFERVPCHRCGGKRTETRSHAGPKDAPPCVTSSN
jgi:hypothetical protein